MFDQLVSSWNRWRSCPQDTCTYVTDRDERRVWLRVPCDVQAICQPEGDAEVVRLAAIVQDISRGEITLVVKQPLDNGSLLCVELPGEHLDSTCHVMAHVIQAVARANGECELTCTFATELRDEELRPFEAKRIRPASPDPRRWVRFPCTAKVSLRPANRPDAEATLAESVDISPQGIGLHLFHPIEIGSLLSLELHGSDDDSRLTLLASVVRTASLSGPGWLIGCNFIRELTEPELKSLH